jgi:hypothetical protein
VSFAESLRLAFFSVKGLVKRTNLPKMQQKNEGFFEGRSILRMK